MRSTDLVLSNSETVKQSPRSNALILAYGMYKEADRTISNAPRPPRGSFLALFRNETDRLGTIKEEALKHEVRRGMQIHAATLDHLPSKEKFQVMCYALRRMKPENRETLLRDDPINAERLCCLHCDGRARHASSCNPEGADASG